MFNRAANVKLIGWAWATSICCDYGSVLEQHSLIHLPFTQILISVCRFLLMLDF